MDLKSGVLDVRGRSIIFGNVIIVRTVVDQDVSRGIATTSGSHAVEITEDVRAGRQGRESSGTVVGALVGGAAKERIHVTLKSNRLVSKETIQHTGVIPSGESIAFGHLEDAINDFLVVHNRDLVNRSAQRSASFDVQGLLEVPSKVIVNRQVTGRKILHVDRNAINNNFILQLLRSCDSLAQPTRNTHATDVEREEVIPVIVNSCVVHRVAPERDSLEVLEDPSLGLGGSGTRKLVGSDRLIEYFTEHGVRVSTIIKVAEVDVGVTRRHLVLAAQEEAVLLYFDVPTSNKPIGDRVVLEVFINNRSLKLPSQVFDDLSAGVVEWSSRELLTSLVFDPVNVESLKEDSKFRVGVPLELLIRSNDHAGGLCRMLSSREGANFL